MPQGRLGKTLLGLLVIPAMLLAQEKAPSQKPAQPAAPAKAEEKKAPDYSQEAFVFEQWHTRVRFEADGTSRQESLARVKVQSDAGVQQLGEQNIGYNSANQKVQIEYVRVRKADGSVVTAGAEAVQDMSTSIAREAPVYTDYRVKHVSVPGLRPGDTLEYKVVTVTETPLAPGHFWFDYDFEKNVIVLDERLEMDVPKSRAVKLKTHPDREPTITEQGDRKIYTWTSRNLERPAEDAEKKPKREEPKGPAVQLTTFQSWTEVGQWYATLEKERVTPTAEIRAQAAKLIEGRTTEMEKIEALYDFVAKNFRYVSLSFGVGRYQPHAAGEVLANQYGDCKDKHTLLASLLEAAGIHAEAVLIASQRKMDEEMPSPSQFDHLITTVQAKGESDKSTDAKATDILWMDTTPEVAPFRLLSANLRGKKALRISRDTPPGLVETPLDPPFASTQSIEIEGKLSELGKLTARIKYTLRGDAELGLRVAFRRTPRNQWKQIAQWAAISDGFRGAVGEIKIGDPAATREPFQFEYALSQPNYLDWSNKKSQMNVPLPSMGLPNAPEEKEGVTEKVELGTPMDAVTKLSLELPANFTARAPVSVAVMRDYAEYRATYKMEQNVLRAERVMKFRLRELPGERAGDYRAFQRAVRNDEGQDLWVESTAAAGAPMIPEGAKATELHESAVAALNNRNYSVAVNLFKRVTELEPKHKFAWNNLGRAYLSLRQLDEAVAAFRKQIEVNPYDEFAYNNLGLALWQQHKLDEAAAAFLKQIELVPLDKFAHGNLGSLYSEQKRYAEAVPELEKATTLTPNNSTLHVSLGQCYLNLGQTDKAMEAFDKAFEIAPVPPVWNNVAYELSVKNVRLDRAQQYAESAVAATAASLRNMQLDRITINEFGMVSSIASFWDTLGWVHFQSGNVEKAEKFVRASWLLRQQGEVGDHLGQIYEKRGRKAEAIKTYAQAMAATRPVPETKGRLAALAGGEDKIERLKAKGAAELSELRTVRLGKLLQEKAEADFLVVFSSANSSKPEDVKFISGSEKVRPLAGALRSAKFPAVFPDETPTRIVRRGTLTCLPDGKCVFVVLAPDNVTTIN
jgi:Flp pilus assembly protein TadD